VGAAGVVIVQLGDGGWAVQRLLAGVLEHELSDRDVFAGDNAHNAGGDTVFEVTCQACGEAGAAAALDVVGHPEGDLR